MADEPRRIVIDVAGVMDKITPEMMAAVNDVMMDGLMKSGTEMLAGLDEVIRMCEADGAYLLPEIAAVARNAKPK